MASSFSNLLRLEKMANGEQSDTWGTTLNTVLEMIEDSIAGRAAVSMPSDANYTLTTANNSTDEARMAILNVASAGSLTATRDIIVPTLEKKYVVKNATTGGQSIRVKTSAGTGVTIPNGQTTMVFCDGTNVVDAMSAVAKLDQADQALTGGVIVTSLSLGTISSGTATPDPGDRPLQHYTNGGAHTLAPSVNAGSALVDITNNATAGAITTSGFTKVTGDAFTTTNAHKFRCCISVGNGGSLLQVQALQ